MQQTEYRLYTWFQKFTFEEICKHEEFQEGSLFLYLFKSQEQKAIDQSAIL